MTHARAAVAVMNARTLKVRRNHIAGGLSGIRLTGGQRAIESTTAAVISLRMRVLRVEQQV